MKAFLTTCWVSRRDREEYILSPCGAEPRARHCRLRKSRLAENVARPIFNSFPGETVVWAPPLCQTLLFQGVLEANFKEGWGCSSEVGHLFPPYVAPHAPFSLCTNKTNSSHKNG